MLGFESFLGIVVKPTSQKKLLTWVYYDAEDGQDDDDKDDDYEDDDEDGQVNDDVEDGEDDGYEDDEDGQVNVHVTTFGGHAQNTGIYSIFCSLYNMPAQGCGARHVVTSILVLLPALLHYCLRSTMSLLAPPPRAP